MLIVEEIIDWLKKYSEKTNLCFVVGVSGGIDSAVVSTLCAKTGIKTHLVNIPIHQKENQVELASKHMEWLKSNFSNVEIHNQDLSEVFDLFKQKLIIYDKELSWVNSKSRLRMVTLYQIAGFYKGLVVGTGNKIEDFGVGFFTKYGDGGVDISPIADLKKSEVKEIAKFLNVMDDIVNAKPTDGLWEDDRTDEEQLGTTYEQLEWAMDFLESLESHQLEVLGRYLELNRMNKHKMDKIPFYEKKKSDSKMKINLFQEIFVEKNSARLEEYIFCINKNVTNQLIDKHFLVVDEEEYNQNVTYFENILKRLEIKEKTKLIKNNNKRFTFNKLIDFAKDLLPEDSIVLVSNLDIFIPEIESWKNVYSEFFKSTDKKICLALARTEYVSDNDQFVDENAWKNGHFADCWGFITPLHIEKEDFPYDIPVGFAPTCDNHMFIILSKKYDHVFNWAEKYVIYHYDIVRKPDVVKNRKGRMITNENTTTLPQKFLQENTQFVYIKPRDNWQSIYDKIKK